VENLAPLRLTDEVAAALRARRPVVALESTIVAHGLPWPENLEVGRALEDAVRAASAVPATIAVVDGEVHVGLAPSVLEHLARSPSSFVKAGAADLAVLCALGGSGATTVSATCFVAARAGIRVFATGGIGGVHRGDGLDVSNDLAVMARSPVAVVSAGAKAILDLPRTLEVLETLGVLVLGVGTAEFPAFYRRSSGLRLEHVVPDARAAARVCATRWAMGDAGGVLLANPIPAADELPAELVDGAISTALAEAAAAGLVGKAVTPFLLSRLAEATGRRSLAANRALAVNNASFAGRVAAELALLS
jgi:pseudouridine-5'-phosphate glycosidase